jgi:hypothetical protein
MATSTREEYQTQVTRVVEEKCKKGEHLLEKIFESGSDMESTVVRWCPVCGSITVDTDYDGRTKPGDIMKMKSPAITKAHT